jgi:hypothetical protein
MSANRFEERLLLELKGYVAEQSDLAAGRQGQKGRRRVRSKRRATWRLASVGVSVAAALAVFATMAGGGALPGMPTSTAPSRPTESGPLVHIRNAAFAIDSEPSGTVDITILQGDEKPDVDAIRNDLAKAGVAAKVVTNVPSCQQLASSPGAPSPVGSAQADIVADVWDHPLAESGNGLGYSVDRSANTRGTTLWIMFSSTLSTIFVERTTDAGPQPNCLSNMTGN